MWLPDETFKSIIEHTPLISIDLIVKNKKDEVLLGKRVNAPAKGCLFIPGGRVRKNETLDVAFVRLVKEELGIDSGITRADAKFLGVFEHFYDDSFFSDQITTHYIVLGYEFILKKNEKIDEFTQHLEYVWKSVSQLKLDNKVHYFTKKYFEII